MLAIQKSARHHGNCTPNILPCRINHNGAVDASKRYWNPIKDADGKTTAYFRGRKLHGKVLKVPKGYKGSVVVTTERVLPVEQEQRGEELEEEQEEEREEEVKVVEEKAGFGELLVWGHEAVVEAEEDCYTRGMEEWIGFAESIHSYEQVDDSKQAVDGK